MKVYLCREIYYDDNTVVKVVDDEYKAIVWKNELSESEREWQWRYYSEFTVE
jgi:hypothetical protein